MIGQVQAGNADELDLAPVRESITDVLKEICSSQAVHGHFDRELDLASRLWTQAAELGWLGLALSESYGGLDMGPKAAGLFHRELGRRTAPGPFVGTLVGAQWLQEFAAPEQQAEFLPRIVAGQLKIAIPARLFPSEALSVAGGRISGKMKMLGSPESDLFIVPVTSDAGGGWAVVEANAVDTDPIDIWDRTREACTVTLEQAEPLRIVAGCDDAARQVMARHLNLALASDSLGATSAILAQTVDYLKTRVQFGRAIGSFQALKHRVAQHTANLSIQSALLDQAVDAAASGSPDADLWAALAKAEVCDACAAIAADCIQLHGGVGHTWEFDVHIFVKRTKLNEMLCGDGRSQRDRAAAHLIEATKAGRTTLEFQL